jgi:phosphoglucomutase
MFALDPDLQRRLDQWSRDPVSKPEIDRLLADENWEEIRDAFGAELTFGTAGLRGKMGVGPNRMNARNVSIATRALAGYVREIRAEARGIVISWDTRHGSSAFAEQTRNILGAHGIKVFAFDGDRPVPELSFAIRETGAIAGVMITASHNPKVYNGYKVSWEHGGQIGQEIAAAILARMRNIGSLDADVAIARPSGTTSHAALIRLAGEMDEKYLASIDAHVLDRKPLSELTVVYDPLYGCGRTLLPAALIRAGVRPNRLHLVEEHAHAPAGKALGDFDGLKSPNPASPGVLDAAIAKARAIGADLVLSTDPDADRLVAAVPTAPGAWSVLPANQTWPVLLDHRLRALKARGRLSADGVIVRSWVTTRLLDAVAAQHGVRTIEVPTGFKWIAEQMIAHDVLGGFEESDGMSIGTHTREKDALLAAVLVAETAARARREAKTLADLRDELFVRFGKHEARVLDLTFEGADGRNAIGRVTDALARDPSSIFGSSAAARFEHRYDGARAFLSDGTTITVRPSGTEPKVKVYVEAIVRSEEAAGGARQLLDETADRIRKIAR